MMGQPAGRSRIARRFFILSILPVDIHKAHTGRGHRESMVRARLPGDSSVCRNLNELKLDRLPGGHARINEPVRIIRCEHWSDRAVPGCVPVTKLDSVPSQKNVIAHLCRRCVINCESNRN